MEHGEKLKVSSGHGSHFLEHNHHGGCIVHGGFAFSIGILGVEQHGFFDIAVLNAPFVHVALDLVACFSLPSSRIPVFPVDIVPGVFQGFPVRACVVAQISVLNQAFDFRCHCVRRNLGSVGVSCEFRNLLSFGIGFRNLYRADISLAVTLDISFMEKLLIVRFSGEIPLCRAGSFDGFAGGGRG